MFVRLLDDDYQLFMKILDYMYKLESHQTSVKSLAEQLGVSRSKISRILIILENEVEKRKWSRLFQIRDSSQGIKIEFSHLYLRDKIFIDLMKDSMLVHLLLSIFNDTYKGLQFFSQEQGISVGTISRKITVLNNFLTDFSLSINLKKREGLVGKDTHVRFFYVTLFWLMYEEKESVILDSSRQLHHTMSTLFSRENNADVHLLELILMVASRFCKKGQHLKVIAADSVIYQAQHPYICFDDFVLKLSKPFLRQQNIFWKPEYETELRYAYFLFSTVTTFSIEDITHINFRHTRMNDRTNPVYEEIISEFCCYFDINITQEEFFFLSFNLRKIHLYDAFFQKDFSSFDLEIEQSLFEESPESFSKVQMFISYLEQKDKRFQALYQNRCQMLFHYTTIMAEIFKRHWKKINLLIMTKYSHAHFDRLGQLILSTVPFPIKLVENISEAPDIIVADFPVYAEKYLQKGIQVFQWNTHPKAYDWERLEQALHEVYHAAHYTKHEARTMYSIHKQYGKETDQYGTI